MFVLVSLKDTVVIKPSYIGSDMKEIMEQELNSRFCSKVIYKVGLCISLWDILKVEESFISDVDGAYYTTVSFRIVCFRPFIDEILIGIVKSLSKAGLRVSLNFFDDVFIPAENYAHLQDTTMSKMHGYGSMRTKVKQLNCALTNMIRFDFV
ncbi:unnamed protein product [Schistosoma mattheei]|uniref:Uncharacterized protein n=1 Tax=Schistosoma mattheei TaxID=31246 RepID=A0AA85BI44_9TREM|nr:unnamed protein product [Schistosoma mattheei]